MSQNHLSRKVDLANWERDTNFSPSEAPANSLKDLRTDDNTLSFWRTEQDGIAEYWENSAIAICGGFKRIDTLDIAWVEEQPLLRQSIEIIESDGNTIFDSHKNLHRDAINLNANKLAMIADSISYSIHANRNCKRFTKKEVLDMIKEGIKISGKSIDHMPKAIKDELKSPAQ